MTAPDNVTVIDGIIVELTLCDGNTIHPGDPVICTGSDRIARTGTVKELGGAGADIVLDDGRLRWYHRSLIATGPR